jgi:hypothetical protein
MQIDMRAMSIGTHKALIFLGPGQTRAPDLQLLCVSVGREADIA